MVLASNCLIILFSLRQSRLSLLSSRDQMSHYDILMLVACCNSWFSSWFIEKNPPSIRQEGPTAVVKLVHKALETNSPLNHVSIPIFAGFYAKVPMSLEKSARLVFFSRLQEGKVFEGQTLVEMDTDFEGVRAGYAKLFNVLALKFSQHGSWAPQHGSVF